MVVVVVIMAGWLVGGWVGWLVGWLVGELVKNSIIRISRYILTNTDLDQVILTLTFI